MPPHRKRRSPGLIAGAVILLVLGGYLTWDLTRTHPTPETVSNGYAPRLGDIVFQSLPRTPQIAMIEDSTNSPLSHCGIVALDRGRWVVIEAVGPVLETPLEHWIARGRGREIQAKRLKPELRASIPRFVHMARTYLGRPYDNRYRMDDVAIYCSELVYKALARACGEKPGRLVTVSELDWKPHEALIRKLEGGPVPLHRTMITPRDLAAAEQFEHVFPVR